MKACYLLLLQFFFLLPLSFAQNSPMYTLESIGFSQVKEFEKIHLNFKENIDIPPVVDIDPGMIHIRFPQTRLTTERREFEFSNSKFIQAVRAKQNRQSILLIVVLRSPSLSFEGFIDVVQSEQQISFHLDTQVSTTSRVSSTENIDGVTLEAEQRFLEGDRITSTFQEQEASPELVLPEEREISTLQAETPNEDWMSAMLTMTLALIVILLFLYLCFFIYNRFLAGKFPNLSSQFPIRIVSTYHLSPKQKIIVIEVNQSYFACGVTQSSIHLLSPLTHKEDRSFLQQLSKTPQEASKENDHTRIDFMKSLEIARNTETETSIVKEKSPVSENARKLETQKETSPSSEERKSVDSNFQTPILPPNDEEETNNDEMDDPSMQKFVNQLNKKIKSLKPIN